MPHLSWAGWLREDTHYTAYRDKPESSLVAQLKACRSGNRTHKFITGIAARLTNGEIREYVDWYAAVKLYIEIVD